MLQHTGRTVDCKDDCQLISNMIQLESFSSQWGSGFLAKSKTALGPRGLHLRETRLQINLQLPATQIARSDWKNNQDRTRD